MSRASVAITALLIAAAAAGAQLPSGTQVEVRLKSRIASNASKPKDAVEAVVVKPVFADGEMLIPAGAVLRGQITAVQAITKPDERAALELEFSKLVDAAGRQLDIAARVADVDNAREIVENGRITGILKSETIAGQIDQGIEKVDQRTPKLGEFLQIVKQTVLREPDPEIVYNPGVEFTLELTKPLNLDGTAKWAEPRPLHPLEPHAALYDLVNSQPMQTTAAGNPPKPSDLTTLMFLGTQENLEAAFKAAEWHSAAELNAGSGLETFRAIAEMRGYKEAPMSVLLLDGQKPDLVFQKQNNTFAKRHHLRIWRRPGDFQGHPVWVCAATQDTGIEFSPENHTFIHKIDSQIDRERAKVVNDLIFGGRVAGLALVERPKAPRQSMNATGDKLETDGRMAVLLLE